MNSNRSQFIKASLALSIFLAGAVLLAAHWFPSLVDRGLFLGMIAFLLTVTTVIHLILLRLSHGNPNKFIRVFMVATMAKLLAYLVFIFVVGFNFRQQAAGLLIGFFVFYICFTFLEVYLLRKHLISKGS